MKQCVECFLFEANTGFTPSKPYWYLSSSLGNSGEERLNGSKSQRILQITDLIMPVAS